MFHAHIALDSGSVITCNTNCFHALSRKQRGFVWVYYASIHNCCKFITWLNSSFCLVKGHVRKGAAYEALKEYSKAAESYQKALDIDPSHEEAATACKRCLVVSSLFGYTLKSFGKPGLKYSCIGLIL